MGQFSYHGARRDFLPRTCYGIKKQQAHIFAFTSSPVTCTIGYNLILSAWLVIVLQQIVVFTDTATIICQLTNTDVYPPLKLCHLTSTQLPYT